MSTSNLSILFLSALTALSFGASRTSFGITLQNPPTATPTFDALSGGAEILLSVGSGLSASDYTSNETKFTLRDGTTIQGLYFKSATPASKVVIASFGLFEDRLSPGAAAFVHNFVENGSLGNGVDALVLDSATSGSFYAMNPGQYSPGAYDEGTILLQVAQTLKSRQSTPLSVRLVTYSRSAIASLHAVIEDQRQGTHAIDGLLAFSSPIDEIASTADIMAGVFGAPFDVTADRPVHTLPLYASEALKLAWVRFETSLESSGGGVLVEDGNAVGQTILAGSEKRLAFLKANPDKAANSTISLDSMDSYTVTTAAALADLGSTTIPVIIVHAKDDPIIPYTDFTVMAAKYASQSNIQTLLTDTGSHCSFAVAYGNGWVLSMIQRVLK